MLASGGSEHGGHVAPADDKVTLASRFQPPTHGFTGGIVWWANKAKADLEKNIRI